MCIPLAESKAKVVCKETFVIEDFFAVFFSGALVEDNTASEYIRTLAATYGCKILQMYEYEANEYKYEAKCERYPLNTG